MGIKSRFKIGDRVVFTTFVEFSTSAEPNPGEQKVEIIRVMDKKILIGSKPIYGVICGACQKFAGKIRSDGSGGYDPETGITEYDQRYLEVEGSYLCWMVKRGMINKPFLVLNEDIDIAPLEVEIPWQYQEQWHGAERERNIAQAREDGRKFVPERGPDGQFLPMTR